MEILESLNEAQREAVGATPGPILVLAGPGSGKTRVITHRIAYLIRTCGVSPHRIIAVTFTNKAAREMQERLGRLVPGSVKSLTLGTFHAICARILRTDGKAIGVYPNFVIYDDTDQLSIVKKALAEADIDPKQYAPHAILNAISAAKSQMLSPQNLLNRSRSYFDEVVKRIYERYQERLTASNALDFDDLLLKVVQLFHKNRDVLTKYQMRYLHILVDEFQDTNTVQYELIKLIGGKSRNIFVVGDPDQSIYSWRFADIRNLLSFEKDYPDAKVILLEQNYRSTRMILDAASHVISINEQRKPRKLWTENEQGEQVAVIETYTEQEEAQFVVSETERLTGVGKFKPGNIAVMFRTNAQSRALEEAFIRYGMPYHLVAGTKFYERREVKDLIAYFRLIQNPSDIVSLERVINVPGRGIGEKTLSSLSAWSKSLGVSEYQALSTLAESIVDSSKKHPFPPHAAKSLVSFVRLLDELMTSNQEKNMTGLFDLAVEKIRYRDYLLSEPAGEDRWDNIKELRTVAKEYEGLPPTEGLSAFLEGVALVSDVDGLKENTDAVTLITLHQAKGLEFPVVFMVGMEDGLLPHFRSFDDVSRMEEERRLCYVGITRAKKKLYLVHAFRRSFMGTSGLSKPSRYLDDIPHNLISGNNAWKQESTKSVSSVYYWNKPPDATANQSPEISLPSFHAGEHVRHPSFGEGVIVSIKPSNNDVEVAVAFNNGGVKKLLVSFARLEKLE